jgi:release factor glutamine methyltransferase
MTDIKQALIKAVELLSNTSLSPQIDAEILLGHVLDTSRTVLYTHPEQQLAEHEQIQYEAIVEKRVNGTPIAYLVGYKEFWSLKLLVSSDTLIPRSETELLVELTLEHCQNINKAHILDLGTGSGAIALAIASERPEWQLFAADQSPLALKLAKFNAQQLKLTNLDFFCSDWFTNVPKLKFNAIVSNPPYIAMSDPHLHQGDVRFEPPLALISGKEGLDALAFLINSSYDHILPGGWLLVEHGYQQRTAVEAFFLKRGYQNIHCWQDLQGLDRVSGGQTAS